MISDTFHVNPPAPEAVLEPATDPEQSSNEEVKVAPPFVYM